MKFIPLVAASERGRAQTGVFLLWGCKKVTSGVFLIDGNISEGEHLGEG